MHKLSVSSRTHTKRNLLFASLCLKLLIYVYRIVSGFVISFENNHERAVRITIKLTTSRQYRITNGTYTLVVIKKRPVVNITTTKPLSLPELKSNSRNPDTVSNKPLLRFHLT